MIRGVEVYNLFDGETVVEPDMSAGYHQREPGGERTLARGDVVCFPPGPEGAHQLRNDTGERVRVALFSTVASSPTGTVYPDSSKVQMRGPGVRFRLRIADELDYWDGEA